MKILLYKHSKFRSNPVTLLIAFCILLFTNVQCKKNKLPIDQLPAATQTGANKFGCLVDGRAYTPTQKYIYNNSFNYGYYPVYGLGLEAINDNRDADHTGDMIIKLRISNLTEGQTYALTDYDVAGKGGVKYTDIYGPGNMSSDYKTNSQVGGSLTITKLDLYKKIVSGTFAFKATDSTSHKTVNVTDGRFDITFN